MNPSFLHHAGGIGRAFVGVLTAAWFLFATLVIVLRYAILPNVDDYRADLERMASRASGETVRIGHIDASWHGLRPVVALQRLEIVDADGGEALTLPSVRATLSWDSLPLLQLRLASIEIDGPRVTVRRDAEGQLFVAGVPIHRKATPDNRGAEWLLAQNAIRVRGANITWRDELAAGATARPDLVLADVDFALVRSGWNHRVALRATPPAALAAPLDLRAVIEHPLFARRFAEPADWRGEVYANVGTGDIVAWRTWLPLPATMDGGHGRARVWLRFADAAAPAGAFAKRLAERTGKPIPAELDRIAGITADLALDEVRVRWGATEYSALASIDGRVDASQTPTAQRFTATHMALQPRDGNQVPPTDFRIERTIGASLDDESGKASLGAIDIGVSLGLVPLAVVPPAIAEKYAALKPRGILDGTTFEWTGPIAAPKTFRFDARFARVSLAAQPPTAEALRIAATDVVLPGGGVRKPHPAFGRPGFDHLDATVSANRVATSAGAPVTTVSIALAGNDATVTAPGLFDEPVLRLARLEAQVGVKLQGDDVEVKIERGAFDNPDVAGTIGMTLRHGPSSGGVGENGGRGWIDLDAKLSRAEVVRVPRYLPNLIGAKARAYLVKALLGGKVSEATFRMHGPLERLDFRTMPGAVAVPDPAPLAQALVAIRDDGGEARRAESRRPEAGRADSKRGEAKAGPDDAIFHALVRVRGATFRYGPARDPDDPATAASQAPSIPWPVFEDVDADVVFDQAKMTILGRSARVNGYRLTDIEAVLPALADPAHVLRVVGHGTGPLQDLVRFVNDSPVARWTRNFTATTRATGDAGLALALDLPLTHLRDAEVAASLSFAGNDLVLNAVIPPLRRIAGRADFTERGLAIDGITGQALGGPLRIDAKTSADGFVDLGVDGTLDVAAMKAATRDEEVAGVVTPVARVADRAAQWLTGSTRYHVGLRLRSRRVAETVDGGAAQTVIAPETTAQPDLVVRSDLVGLGIALPAPLAKPADARWPLRVAITRSGDVASGSDGESIQVSLADVFDANVSRRRNADGQLAVTRAGYGVGGDRSNAADGPTTVNVNLASLDLDAWRDVARQFAAAPHPATAPAPTTGGLDNLLPERGTFKTPLLHAAGRDFTNVSIDAQRLRSGWQGDVVADQVAGRLSYTDVSGAAPTRSGVAPASSGRLVARLERLTIPQAEAGSAHVQSALDAGRQKDFPAIDVVVDRFELRGRSLGKLEVVAENVVSGSDHEWQLEKLGLTMPEARFTAHGAWGHGDGVENTRLTFEIEASDVGQLMDRFGMTRTIADGTARLTGNAAWQGGPSTIDFGTMEGRLQLAADKGRFLKADPGIAKLLNILSLQGLARRLTFDFSDVFAAGFAFDTVRADATVDKGILKTDDFTMRGVQATVTMVGAADLARETTDLHVRVVPDINAGAASLGVAVINPVIGLATFAAQYLFKDRIADALSFEYNVAGPWTKPDVTKIDRNGKATAVVPRSVPAAPSTAESTARSAVDSASETTISRDATAR